MKYIAWLNGCSVATGTIPECEAHARRIFDTTTWQDTHIGKPTTLRITTYGRQTLVSETRLDSATPSVSQPNEVLSCNAEEKEMTQTREIRVVLNQCGAVLELVGHRPEPVVIAMIRPSQIAEFGKWCMNFRGLSETNPDMRYATIEQVAHRLAEVWLESFNKAGMEGVTLNSRTWTYNASTNEYSAC